MTHWQEYEEKTDNLSENDELVINSWWIVKRVKALRFKWERWERGLTGEKWEQGRPGEKWDPWKNFEYSDFTEEQLEGLRWPQGLPWRDWTWAWDMLGVNNLSDLGDIVVARENLDVFSKNEVEDKISENIFSKNYNDLINKPDLENNPYQKIQDIRDNNYLPQSEIFKNHNTHFWFIRWRDIGLSGARYDVMTFNWWVADNHPNHPVKQLALWPDWVFFRKQNGENSWGKWVQVVNQYWSVEIPWNNWEYWWWETLQFFKNSEKNLLWKIGWRSDYNNWLLFEFLNWWDLRQPFWLKPTWEIWQKYYTEAWDGRIFKMWSRFALSWTHHWVGWHEYQITWWDLSSNPEVAGKHKDGWWWLFFGASDMRYLQMKSWNINIWNNNLNIFLWNKLFIQNLPISPAWLSSWQIRRDGNNIKIVP